MRVTVEIDEKSAGGGAGVIGTSSDGSGPVAPVDVLKLAADTGAINGGPAPTLATSIDSSPHLLHGVGVSEAASQALALSGGAAATHK